MCLIAPGFCASMYLYGPTDCPSGRGDGEKPFGMPDRTGLRIWKIAGVFGLAFSALAAQLSRPEMLPTIAWTWGITEPHAEVAPLQVVWLSPLTISTGWPSRPPVLLIFSTYASVASRAPLNRPGMGPVRSTTLPILIGGRVRRWWPRVVSPAFFVLPPLQAARPRATSASPVARRALLLRCINTRGFSKPGSGGRRRSWVLR